MNKIIVFSTDVYTDLDNIQREHFKEIMFKIISDGNKVVFTSRSSNKIESLRGIEILGKNNGVYFILKDKLKAVIKQKTGMYFIMVSNADTYLQLAANNKILFVLPEWCKNLEQLPLKYGIKIESIDKFISIIGNQNNWFYRLDLDDKTTILSLTNANNRGAGYKENEMINEFREYLKKGNKKYYKAILYHFLAAISNNKEFRDIKDWGIFPSSGINFNEDLNDFKEKARKLMNGKKVDPILIRHKATWKSHESKALGKDRLPSDRHFETIIINPVYKNKLKDRVVCIFDDYLTNGTSFEATRNLLLHEGVKKIFFVSLGKFHKNRIEQYCMQNYIIKGNLYEPGYSYTLKDRKWFNGRFNYNAVTEIESLYDILYEGK